ncbi:MAG: GNAT family protein [Kibdelosporangium sp.]
MLSLHLAEGAELRALEPWNAKEFAGHIEAAREHLTPWLPWVPTIVDEDSARVWLRRYADRLASDDGRLYGIWVDGRLMGGTLFRVFNAKGGVCEVGVWLDPSVVGRGLITRAAGHMIEWAVCARGMSRIEWLVLPGNSRSIAVAQRLGMNRDGVLRQAFELRGTRHDVEVWSLLATEWRAGNVASTG